jgi:hypothetical protein
MMMRCRVFQNNRFTAGSVRVGRVNPDASSSNQSMHTGRQDVETLTKVGIELLQYQRTAYKYFWTTADLDTATKLDGQVNVARIVDEKSSLNESYAVRFDYSCIPLFSFMRLTLVAVDSCSPQAIQTITAFH